MGSDIYSESAVAIRLEDFFDKPAVKKKAVREGIANTLYQEEVVDDAQLKAMSKNKSGLIETLLSTIEKEICDESGYELCSEANRFVIETFCQYVGVDLDDLPDFHIRAFRSCRQAGYEVEIDVPYIMFESYDLFETVMTEQGKIVAKALGADSIEETSWTVHSY
jgi:hypothetical protein